MEPGAFIGFSFFVLAFALAGVEEPENPVGVIPLPAGLPLLLTALGGLALLRQRQRDR
jgi:hypothetical protein